MTMTISQALRKINKLEGYMKEYRERAEKSVLYKVENPPAFMFTDSMEKMASTREELISLQTSVARTNAQSHIDWDGKKISLAYAIRTLSEYKSQLAWLKGSMLPVRSHRETESNEIDFDDEGKRIKHTQKWICALPETDRADLIEKLQNKFDALNDVVETTNHKLTLIEGT